MYRRIISLALDMSLMANDYEKEIINITRSLEPKKQRVIKTNLPEGKRRTEMQSNVPDC